MGDIKRCGFLWFCGFRSVVSACSVITPIFHIKQSLSPSFSLSECHSSCSGCTGGSFQNCTSCVRPRILQQEQCLDKCSHGFYVQDRSCQGGYGCYSVPSHKRNLFPCGLICSMDYFINLMLCSLLSPPSACHPSCKECTGPSQADCSACPAHASLHNGYCRTSCPEGQYPNAVGDCIGEWKSVFPDHHQNKLPSDTFDLKSLHLPGFKVSNKHSLPSREDLLFKGHVRYRCKVNAKSMDSVWFMKLDNSVILLFGT